MVEKEKTEEEARTDGEIAIIHKVETVTEEHERLPPSLDNAVHHHRGRKTLAFAIGSEKENVRTATNATSFRGFLLHVVWYKTEIGAFSTARDNRMDKVGLEMDCMAVEIPRI